MYLNRVYLENLAERRYRVVFEYLNYIMAFDIDDDNAWPVRIEIEELQNPELFSQEIEPYILPPVENGSISASKRDEAYQSISHLLDNYTLLFDKASRNHLIREQVSKAKKSRIYILRQLRRYWKRG